MGLETILAGGFAAIVAIIAAFATGHFRGKTIATATARADQARAEAIRVAESNQKATEAQLAAARNAKEVNENVSNLPVGNALDELRRDFARDSDGNKDR